MTNTEKQEAAALKNFKRDWHRHQIR